MATGLEDESRRFVETEPIGRAGEACEQVIWQAVKAAFRPRDSFGFWSYPIFSKTGEQRKEPDILVIDRELGIIVIEVKGYPIEQILNISGPKWEYTEPDNSYCSPNKQAENQLFALLGYCDREELLRRQIIGRAIVALPKVTAAQWQAKGFADLPSCPPIIFADQMSPAMLLQQIQQAAPVVPGREISEPMWQLLQAVIGGSPVYRKALPSASTLTVKANTRASILQQLNQRLYDLDLQQVHIGMEIPPGAQRIRGIAGSGKTVLLCQKAAHMHVKHPDWQIALVFFTRSLYEQMEGLVDQWVRHFSCGDLYYRGNPAAQAKLQILHAWGAQNRPGFYRTICEAVGIKPQSISKTYPQPHEGLAHRCQELLADQKIPPLFDAILIDEGQDLVVDNAALAHEEKQVFYWLAYQALRPCDPDHLEQRRLIWAYDEAQSLSSQAIPTAAQLFGSAPPLNRLVTGIHRGGIRKSEIMHRCYRTPGPILTAAHAIGMGLLRPTGMLAGLTRKTAWEAIGYQVTGDFRKIDQPITIHRPPANSPNPVPQLWPESIIDVEIYRTRQEELTALAQQIRHNLEFDQLNPSRDILVVILGNSQKSKRLETFTAEFLIQQGIDIYIPSALQLNTLNPQYPNKNPDRFWHEGGVTISQIYRAKGNEASMVYVVGFDQVAQDEGNIALRNQLFVALTRAKGWVKLSGIGQYPMYEEMQKVLQSGYTFNFLNQRPKRNWEDEEAGEE